MKTDSSAERLAPIARVASLHAYRPPAPDPRIDLRLDANEGVRVPGPVLDALRGVDAERVRRYPSAASVEAMLAERHGVMAEQVVVTAGGDDALGRLAAAYLEPGRSAVVATPTFEMIPLYVAMAGAELRTANWWSGEYPTDAVCGLITNDTALVYLVTPNNPTGLSISADAVRAISDRAREGTIVVLDLAYIEFAGDDLMPLVTELRNVVAVRTFSKAWGLAGLRAGYAVGPASVIDTLRAVGHPYAVAGPSLLASQTAVLLGPDACGVTDTIDRVREERALLAAVFNELCPNEPAAIAGDANFVLARVPDPAAFRESLANAGIAVRAWPGRAGFEHLVRVTCPGNAHDFDRLTAAIRAALGDPR